MADGGRKREVSSLTAVPMEGNDVQMIEKQDHDGRRRIAWLLGYGANCRAALISTPIVFPTT